jgi:hypothetical protein
MENMSSITLVPYPLATIQVIPEVAVLRDMMHMIVDHLKWIEKLVCVCIVIVVYELLLLSSIDWCMNFFYCHIVIHLCGA